MRCSPATVMAWGVRYMACYFGTAWSLSTLPVPYVAKLCRECSGTEAALVPSEAPRPYLKPLLQKQYADSGCDAINGA